jgi:Nif-specific regulatory protein
MDNKKAPESRSQAHENAGGTAGSRMDDRLAIIQDISLALNSTLDPGLLIERILDASIRYTGATTGSVILIQPDRTLKIMAAWGLGTDVEKEVRLKIGEGVTGWVAQNGKPLNVPDVRADKRYVCLKEHIRSELAAPMVLDRKTIGVISVDSTRIANFSEEDLQLLTIVGTQAAQILQNATAFADLRRKTEQDETLLEIAQVFGSALDFGELFQRVGEIIHRRSGMERSFLVLLSPEPDELSIRVAYGMTPEEMARGRYRIGEGITGRVVKTGKPIGVKDIRDEPKFLGRTGAYDQGEKLSFLAHPVKLEGRVVGVLGAVKRFPGDAQFEEDMALLQIVSSALTPAVKIHFGVAREKEVLLRENRLLKEELKTIYHFDNLVGSSPVMEKVYGTIRSVARGRSTVLIRGESGTGKELIAHAIHFNSPRAEKPFVRVNCAAIPENLLEAELFGHVKGSFTGAIADRKGKFAAADGGTLFLDEIGDMTPALQVRILRVLQEREFEPVGSDTQQKVDVRVIAATNRDLEEMLEQGRFREDLYYRLNVVPIVVPPLRERPEDIPLLVDHFLGKFRRENQLPDLTIDPEAVRLLTRYRWPGNVRELENVVERATLLCDGKTIRPADIPLLPDGRPSGVGGRHERPASFQEALAAHIREEIEGPAGKVWDRLKESVEKTLLVIALERVGGVRLKAAEILGIHRNTLRKKLEEYGMDGSAAEDQEAARS